MPRRPTSRSGLTLAEMVIALAGAILLWSGLVGLFGTFMRAQVPGSETVGEEEYSLAPNFLESARALDLHARLIDDLGLASAAYVLGGAGMDPAQPAQAQGTMTGIEAINLLWSNSVDMASAPLESLESSLGLAAALRAAGVQWEYRAPLDAGLGAASEDFTIVLFAAPEVVLSAVRCQSRRAGGHTAFRVFRISAADYQEYSFCVPDASADGGLMPYAYHTWAEVAPVPVPGPVFVRLPDPYCLLEPGLGVKSRFRYAIPLHPR